MNHPIFTTFGKEPSTLAAMYPYYLMIKLYELLKSTTMNSLSYPLLTQASSRPGTRTTPSSPYPFTMVNRFYSRSLTCCSPTSNLLKHFINILNQVKSVSLYIMILQMTTSYIQIRKLLIFLFMTKDRISTNCKSQQAQLKTSNVIEQQFTQLNLLMKIPILQKKKNYKDSINMSHQVTTQFL